MPNLNEYLKVVKLKVEIDDNSKKEASEKFSKETKKSISESFKNVAKDESVKIGESVLKGFKNGWSAVASMIGDYFSQILKDGWAELQNMANYSTLSNERTRELAFTYGFNSSQGYGFDKAMSLMGFNSEEDLFWASDWQKQKFQDIMTKYTEKYNKLYDSGFFEEYLDFQYEWADFKQEMQMEVVEFFMDNKELIKSGMLAILKIAEGVLKLTDWLGEKIGVSTYSTSQNVSDLINNYFNNGGNKTVTITNNNNFNNVNGQNYSEFANPGEMTYEQIIQALM